MLRNDDEVDAESVRDAQDGPEVLRIGDGVDDEDEVRLRLLHDLIEIRIRRLRYLGHYSVVYAAPRQPVDLIERQIPHRHARALGLPHQPLMPRRLLPRHADIANPLRMRPDRFEDWIDAVDDHPAQFSVFHHRDTEDTENSLCSLCLCG